MTSGLDDIDLYITSYQPARRLAAIVPLLVILVVLLLDPPTALVLVLTGPVLVLLLAVIGGRTRIVSGRRAIELRWLGAFFLDMLQGLATLRMFGRGREQVETIRAVSRQYGETTMDVLRTAFQTALVLEWGAAVATAVVAVEVSLRLIDGQMPFDRALAVLVITPEFFLPLRQLAIRYHSGSAGRAAAERLFEILDTVAVPRSSDGRPAPRPAAAREPTRPSGMPARATSGSRTSGSATTAATRRCAASTWSSRTGRVVALVGATGAGKTTCSSLLLRFIEPDVGAHHASVAATLGELDRSAWLAAVAWVPQRPHLFHGSVADNIRLARPGATDAEVRDAAQRGQRGGVHRGAAAGLRHPHRRGRRPAQRRAATAPGHRARVPQGRPVPHPRRGDVAPGRGLGGGHRRRHPGPGARTHGAHHLPPVAPRGARGRRGRCTRRRRGSRHGGRVTTVFRRELRLLAPHRWWIVAGVLLGFLAIGSSIGLMAVSAWLISRAALISNVADVALAITAVRVLAISPRRLPLPRALRHPPGDVPDPVRPAGLVLRRHRAARPGAPGGPTAAATC